MTHLTRMTRCMGHCRGCLDVLLFSKGPKKVSSDYPLRWSCSSFFWTQKFISGPWGKIATATPCPPPPPPPVGRCRSLARVAVLVGPGYAKMSRARQLEGSEGIITRSANTHHTAQKMVIFLSFLPNKSANRGNPTQLPPPGQNAHK